LHTSQMMTSKPGPPLAIDEVRPIESGQALLQFSQTPLSLDMQSRCQQVLSVVERDREELLQYLASKHECLVMNIKGLAANGAQADPFTLGHRESVVTIASRGCCDPIVEESGQSGASGSPARASWSPTREMAPYSEAKTKESADRQERLAPNLCHGDMPLLPSEAECKTEPPPPVSHAKPEKRAIFSKVQCQSEPSDAVDEPVCKNEDNEQTVLGRSELVGSATSERFTAQASLYSKASGAVQRYISFCKRRTSRDSLRSGRLRQTITKRKLEIHTPMFDAFVGAIIIINAAFLCAELQWRGYLTSVELGLQEDAGGWTHAKVVFAVSEQLFTAFFILELMTRLCISGPKYFRDLPNVFDTGLVMISIVDVYILQPMGQGGSGNLTFMRFARILKFMRVLRIVRVMKLFSSLRILGRTIITSFYSLLWSMVLLGLIMGMFGMILCGFLTDWIRDEKNDQTRREWVFKHYGSSSRAFYTMFEATLSGCWPNYVRPLVEINNWFAVFSIVYVSIVVFAIIRIITALFLKETLQNAYEDADMMINEQLKKKQSYLAKLAQAFEVMDESGDGTITYDEFESMMSNPDVKAYLSVLDLEVHETKTLFHLLDGGDGQITYGEFIEGILRMKGQARSIDLICLQKDVSRLHEAVTAISDRMGGLFPGAEQKVRRPMPRGSMVMKRALNLAAVPTSTNAMAGAI